MRVGILEDDRAQREVLRQLIAAAGHDVVEFDLVADCLDGMSRDPVDLLVVDWRLPDGTGGDVISWVRSYVGEDLPIMVVTVLGEEADIVAGLQMGADDFIVKPIAHNVFKARLDVLARRNKQAALHRFRLGPYQVDTQKIEISIDGSPVVLTQREFDLASYFLRSPNKMLSRQHLLIKIWGPSADIDSRTVDVHISRVRKKLDLEGGNGWKLSTLYGMGYRLERVEPSKSSETLAG